MGVGWTGCPEELASLEHPGPRPGCLSLVLFHQLSLSNQSSHPSPIGLLSSRRASLVDIRRFRMSVRNSGVHLICTMDCASQT